MRRTFKYKVKLSPSTEHRLENVLFLCRRLYNACLEQRIDTYKRYKKSVSWVDQCRELIFLKNEFPEYKEVGAHVLQNVVRRLDAAYQSFFRRVKRGETAGFPRFKGRDRYNSFTYPDHNGWKLDGKYLILSKVGRLKLFLSRPILGDIKTVTIRRNNLGEWFVSFSCDNVPDNPLPDNDREIGIDVGLKVFLADSDENFVENPRWFRSAERQLRVAQRSLSRKKLRSSRWYRAKRKVAKLYQKITNQRIDFINKVARFYIQNYGIIYIESLTITNMVRNKHFSKSISDANWGRFFNRLFVAAEEARREVIRINPRNTSQLCLCGEMVKKSLAVRVHKCPDCGLEIDRDILAAKNILRLGQSLQALSSPIGGFA